MKEKSPQHNMIQSSSPLWWVGMLIVLFVAAILNFTGYDYGLPYIERPNEAQNLAEVYIWRGLFNVEEEKPGYPPGILGVYYGCQLAYEATHSDSAIEHPDTIMQYVRFSAAVTNLITTLIVGLTARKFGGNLAGWIASLAWVSFPLVTEWTLVGHPQAWEVLFYTSALYFAILTLQHKKPLWAILSIAAGLGAVIFKYPALPVLGLGVGAVFWLIFAEHDSRKRWITVLTAQIILIVLCGLWLLLGYDALRMTTFEHAETEVFTGGGLFNLLNPLYTINMLGAALNQIEMPVLLFLGLLIGGSWFLWRKAEGAIRVSWVLLVGLSLSSIWFLTSYLRWDDPTRHTTPFSGLLTIIVTVAIIQLGQFLSQQVKRPLVLPVLSFVMAALWIVPPLSQSYQIAQNRAIPITQAGLATWSADALGEGAILVDNNNLRTFTREWGGYTGPLRAWVYKDILQRSLDGWIEEYVYYAQLTPGQVEALARTEEGSAMLDDMLLLKQFPSPDSRRWRGPDLMIYRLWDMREYVNVVLGEQIELLGYDLSQTELHAGETLEFKPYWQAITQPTTNYNVYLHLVPLDSRQPVAQADGSPASINRLTSTWTDTTEVFLGIDFTLTIPNDIEAGKYRLIIGLYDFQTGQRLLTPDGNDFIEIDRITILPQDT